MNEKTGQIYLNEISRVQQFISDIFPIDADIDMVKGRYIIDARSIMGIFGLDLSEPVTIMIHSDDENQIAMFQEIVKKYA